jgi:hypothetical protein
MLPITRDTQVQSLRFAAFSSSLKKHVAMINDTVSPGFQACPSTFQACPPTFIGQTLDTNYPLSAKGLISLALPRGLEPLFSP